MNAIDIVLMVPMAFLMYKGWKRGLVREVATLVGVVAGIWASVHLSQQVAEWLQLGSEVSVLVAFLVCFIGAMVLAYCAGRMVEGLMKAAHIGVANRIAGATLGLAKAVCVLAVLLNYLVMFDSKGELLKEQTRQESLLYAPVYHTGNFLTASLKGYIADHKEGWRKELAK